MKIDENILPKVGKVIEYCAGDILEITKSDDNLWIYISIDFVGYD